MSLFKCVIFSVAIIVAVAKTLPNVLTVHKRNYPVSGKCMELSVLRTESEAKFKEHKVEGYEEGYCANAGFDAYAGESEVCSSKVAGKIDWCLPGKQFVSTRGLHRSNYTRTIHKFDFPNDGECGEITLPIDSAYDKERIFGFYAGNCSKHGNSEYVGIKHDCMWEFPCSFWCDDFYVYVRANEEPKK
jgi:hypothetical protein